MGNKSKEVNYRRFSNLGFDDFRHMALDKELSKYEKIGFPDEFREGFERHIFEDIQQKLPCLADKNRIILDIGPGCSDLPHHLVNLCKMNQHQLYMIDNEEMLALLPDSEGIHKEAAYYPHCPTLMEVLEEKVDAIICYSVFHYIFVESNVFEFLDQSLTLLAPGGRLLIGDIPNISKRKRFLSSDTGKAFHKKFMKTTEEPVVAYNHIEPRNIDDGVVLGLMMRARNAGFDAYIIPQGDALPMANRREDLLIIRP